jgi:hypothetical protein
MPSLSPFSFERIIAEWLAQRETTLELGNHEVLLDGQLSIALLARAAATCESDIDPLWPGDNLMTPTEFVEWLALRVKTE